MDTPRTNTLPTSHSPVIRQELLGSVAIVTLDRPRALNALTEAMRSDLTAWLTIYPRDPNVYAVVLQSAVPRAFSVGSDVREVVAFAREDLERARATFRHEYALNWRIECFSKPIVSLIDGLVMGGGVGISLYGTHRVAGAGYRFAMPETAIGFFPDVGVCHAFARMPDNIGVYLALTGRTIARADAYHLGLITHCIEAGHFDEIKRALGETMPVDPLLDGLHREPGEGELERHRSVIATCFSQNSVPEILDRLRSVTGEAAHWAHEVARDLERRSPLALAVTLDHVRACGSLDLRDTLHRDYRLACRFLEAHDFYEGVRAVLVDKDGSPGSQPPNLGLLSSEVVARYSAPLEGAAWMLPTRSEMQAARA